MVHPRISTTIVAIVLVVVAGLFYAAFMLYGAWVDGKQHDGKRQKIREKGQQPVTESTGEVHTREPKQEPTNGNHRSR